MDYVLAVTHSARECRRSLLALSFTYGNDRDLRKHKHIYTSCHHPGFHRASISFQTPQQSVAMPYTLHIISKKDNAQHGVCHMPDDLPPLGASSVRAQTDLISLSSNNLTYASLGNIMDWWDTYPVPESATVPSGTPQDWGIVQAWGYGRVTESTIDAIAPGSLLWGLWPTSSYPVDLNLRQRELAGSWAEISNQRSSLMTIYNVYQQVEPVDRQKMKMTALCKVLWMAANLMHKSSFTQNIHPMGEGDEWTEQDADLSKSVVVSLSASSKTGRSFAWELAKNRDVKSDGPLGLLQFTSAPAGSLPSYADSDLPIKTVSYSEEDTLSWTTQFKPSRIVIIDFGVPKDTLSRIYESSLKLAEKVLVVAVGNEAKVYSTDDLAAKMNSAFIKVQLNTSPLRDAAMKKNGAEVIVKQLNETWEKCLDQGTFDGLQVETVHGVEGDQGIEGVWERLCKRQVKPNVGFVVDLATQ